MKFDRFSKAASVLILAALIHSPGIHGQDLLALPVAGALLVAEPLVIAEPLDPEAVPIPDSILDTYALSVPEIDVFSGTETSRSDFTNPAAADRNKDRKLSRRELGLQDLRGRLEIYDLNRDKKISEDEIAAANQVSSSGEDETLRSLMQRFSVNSTYLDATGGENTKPRESRIKEKAPSELRFTLFSIPLRD